MTPETARPLIRLTAPLIDKLALTIPVIGAAEQGHVIESIEGLRERHGLPQLRSHFQRGYAYAAVLPLSGANRLLVQAKPTRPRAKQSAFARIEFNPSKVGAGGMHEFHTIAASLFPADYTRHARVSRLDVAVDAYGTRISNLAIRSRRHQKSMVVLGRHGDIETIYLGVRRSGTQIAVYDKTTQLRETEGIRLADPCIRFEIRIRTLMRVSELANLRNPFSGLEIFFGPDDALVGLPHERQMFCDSISRRGFHAALKMLPVSVQNAYERAIAERRCSFWKPDEFWSGWGQAVEALGLIPL